MSYVKSVPKLHSRFRPPHGWLVQAQPVGYGPAKPLRCWQCVWEHHSIGLCQQGVVVRVFLIWFPPRLTLWLWRKVKISACHKYIYCRVTWADFHCKLRECTRVWNPAARQFLLMYSIAQPHRFGWSTWSGSTGGYMAESYGPPPRRGGKGSDILFGRGRVSRKNVGGRPSRQSSRHFQERWILT